MGQDVKSPKGNSGRSRQGIRGLGLATGRGAEGHLPPGCSNLSQACTGGRVSSGLVDMLQTDQHASFCCGGH
eukprot:39607-Chlamydomonas_euryale.AAC.11